MALLDRVAFSREFGQKRTQRRWCGWREIVLLTEVDIKPGPFVVVQVEGFGHMSLVQAPFETSG